MFETITKLPEYRVKKRLLNTKDTLLSHLKYHLLKEHWELVSSYALEIAEIDTRIKQVDGNRNE